jgi:hypothetical protein
VYSRSSRIRKSALWWAVSGLLVLGGCQSGPASNRESDASVPYAAAVVAKTEKPDSTSWPLAQGTLDGVTYSFKYPEGWGETLTYCAPGAAKAGEGEAHLPAGCVSTDFLVGKKARDVGRISGEPLVVNGKSAVRVVDSSPDNVLVSRIYTLMVYDSDGSALFGLVSMVGPNTTQAVQDDVAAKLSEVTATLHVEKR